jgi:hypothetical protein
MHEPACARMVARASAAFARHHAMPLPVVGKYAAALLRERLLATRPQEVPGS